MAYQLQTRTIEMDGCDPVEITSAYTPGGAYIGDEAWAQKLEELGIAPELRAPDNEVCSIGFCEREQKWYGWSHRAMYGFGVGSEVKRGDCAYSPTDEADFRDACLRFWTTDEPYHTKGRVEDAVRYGERGALVTWTYTTTVPNQALRGTDGSSFMPYPTVFGRGEWIAQTLDDAKQMACDFAEGVD
jgi:hypothetical protein